MDQSLDSDLSELWYDIKNNSAFTGINTLFRAVKERELPYTRNQVIDWLKQQEVYQLYRPARRRFKRAPVITYGLNFLLECDLAFFPDLKWQMGNRNVVLVCIDVFSKFIMAEPIRSKKSMDVTAAFEKIFAKRVPQLLRTDAGLEFLNSDVQSLFKKHGIHHYIARNAPKAANAERAIKTLKSKVYKYAFKRKIVEQDFQNLVTGLNNTFNRRIGMKPSEVSIYNSQVVFERLYPDLYKNVFKKSKPLYNVGDVVRISKLKSAFQKGARQNFTSERFEVTRVLNTRSPPQYKLKSLEDNKEIYGTFFAQELMLATSVSSPTNKYK